MSASTSPDNITYPTSTDSFGPLETAFATMAASIQTALSATKTYRTADLNSLNGLTGMASGAIATVIEGGALFDYNGTIWIQVTNSVFATTTLRDSAYLKATGAYKVITARATVSADGITYGYFGTVWAPFSGALAGCRVTTNVAGATTPATPGQFAIVPWATSTYDPQAMHSNTVNNSRITVPWSGYYRIKGKLSFSTGATGALQIAISNAPLAETTTYVQFATGAFADPCADTVVFLTAGQYVEIWMGSTTASISLFSARCYFEVFFVSGV